MGASAIIITDVKTMENVKSSEVNPEPGGIVPKKAQKRIFFPNLDGLRFFSYASVFFFHVWLLYFDRYHIPGRTEKTLKFLFQNGEVGVNFFFVLSGFLITYLLIKEKQVTGRIHVGNFYVRRILRIWPLFYLVVIFGIVVYPQLKMLLGGEQFPIVHPWTYFVFANNFDFLHHGAPAMISILWSVAIEEQFYLCWPLILALTPLSKFKYVFFTIIIGCFVFRLFHAHDERVLMFHTFAVIGDMALGALSAYYIIFSKAFQKMIAGLPRWFILCMYALTAAVILFRKDIFHDAWMVAERIVFASLFAFMILEQNYSDHSFYKVGHFKRVSKLGVYTYGLYCIHVSAMTITELLLTKAGLNMRDPKILLVTAAIAFFVTIGLAWLSYHYFEKRFLKLKNKFAFIVK